MIMIAIMIVIVIMVMFVEVIVVFVEDTIQHTMLMIIIITHVMTIDIIMVGVTMMVDGLELGFSSYFFSLSYFFVVLVVTIHIIQNIIPM
tara:strand:- start:171 stop:440 length:270 start_codon:yes stop_codon:yes gene_type:complete